MNEIECLVNQVSLNANDFTPDQKESMIRTLFLSCLGKSKEQDHKNIKAQFRMCSGYFAVCDMLKRLGVDE